MGEDELERCGKAKKVLFLSHDQIVRPLSVVAVGLIVLGGIRPQPPFLSIEK